jgi:hypothetical protein
MTRRRALCGLLLASVVLACFAAWLWMANPRKLWWERISQVKKGMSREEVIRIMGRPPEKSRVPSNGEYWYCDDEFLFVQFDNGGSCIGVWGQQPPTLTVRIRRWLGL